MLLWHWQFQMQVLFRSTRYINYTCWSYLLNLPIEIPYHSAPNVSLQCSSELTHVVFYCQNYYKFSHFCLSTDLHCRSIARIWPAQNANCCAITHISDKCYVLLQLFFWHTISILTHFQMHSNNYQFYHNTLEIPVFSLNDYVHFYAKKHVHISLSYSRPYWNLKQLSTCMSHPLSGAGVATWNRAA